MKVVYIAGLYGDAGGFDAIDRNNRARTRRWEHSRGTQAEMAEWAKTGKPVFYDGCDRDMLLEWADPHV